MYRGVIGLGWGIATIKEDGKEEREWNTRSRREGSEVLLVQGPLFSYPPVLEQAHGISVSCTFWAWQIKAHGLSSTDDTCCRSSIRATQRAALAPSPFPERPTNACQRRSPWMFPTRETPSRLEPIEHSTSDTRYIGGQSKSASTPRLSSRAAGRMMRHGHKMHAWSLKCTVCLFPPFWSSPFPGETERHAELTSTPSSSGFLVSTRKLERRAKAIQPLTEVLEWEPKTYLNCSTRGFALLTKPVWSYHLGSSESSSVPLDSYSSRPPNRQPPSNTTIRRQLQHRQSTLPCGAARHCLSAIEKGPRQMERRCTNGVGALWAAMVQLGTCLCLEFTFASLCPFMTRWRGSSPLNRYAYSASYPEPSQGSCRYVLVCRSPSRICRCCRVSHNAWEGSTVMLCYTFSTSAKL